MKSLNNCETSNLHGTYKKTASGIHEEMESEKSRDGEIIPREIKSKAKEIFQGLFSKKQGTPTRTKTSILSGKQEIFQTEIKGTLFAKQDKKATGVAREKVESDRGLWW
jgi:hypothetical protein